MSYTIKNDAISQKNNLLTLLYMIPFWICIIIVSCLICANYDATVKPLLDAFNPKEFLLAIIGLGLILVLLSIPIIVVGITLISLFRLIKSIWTKNVIKLVIFNDDYLNFIYKDPSLNFNCKYSDIESIIITARKLKYVLPRKGITNSSYIEIPSTITIEFILKNNNKIVIEKYFNTFDIDIINKYDNFNKDIQPYLNKLENVKYENV